jgi:spore coat polysaccharide biosynthesis protein SpsF (cytidylyltransferase family)
MSFAIGIQVRATSARLPGKSFYSLGGRKLCEWSILQARLYFPNSPIYLLVPDDNYRVLFEDISHVLGASLLAGSKDDVLSRYEALARIYPDRCIVRWTADNPIKCEQAMAQLQRGCLANERNYIAFERLRKTGVEIIPSKLLIGIRLSNYFTEFCVEHVTYGLRNSSFSGKTLLHDDTLDLQRSSDQKLTVDTINDFRVVEKFVNREGLSPDQKINLANYNV